MTTLPELTEKQIQAAKELGIKNPVISMIDNILCVRDLNAGADAIRFTLPDINKYVKMFL
jgi:hypothetical protein